MSPRFRPLTRARYYERFFHHASAFHRDCRHPVQVMTPLTHAAVGAAFYQQLRTVRRPRWIWLCAFPLAFLSHYALDAIPHFETAMPILKPMERTLVMLGFGLLGAVLAVLMLRWNRETGTIWLVLSLWIGLGPNSFSILRVLTAALALVLVAWTSNRSGGNRWSSSAYLLACMTAIAPDLLPATFRSMRAFHNRMHYKLDWATMIHHAYSRAPIPASLIARLHDPYFLLGYTLELGVEACIFFTALYLCSRKGIETGKPADSAPATALELSQKT
jgi:hypothetical protein